ncbi:MAG: ABC transporter ATP-binding protein [Actinomycetota bacterium]|nr:ABC transporter ATP-binding protein [Actinomycetota bacterium]
MSTTTDSTPPLQLRGITKTYADGDGTIRALVDVDVAVAAGELVGVMGPSGSGKSTLLNIAGGLESPSAGEVVLQGQELGTLDRDERARLRRGAIGYIFQDLNLLDALTAAENVALPLELDGASPRDAQGEALAALEVVGVAAKAHRFGDDLSGGERQRVAIARALVGNRPVILADEPTGALDSVNGEQVMRLLRKACDRGAAGIVVTHDAQLAAWADRVVFLRDGRAVDTAAHVPVGDVLAGPSA